MNRSAFTIVELLIVLAVMGILLSLMALDVRPLNNSARNAANEIAATVRLARSRAMATTSAHRLVAASTQELSIESAINCSDPEGSWSVEPGMTTELRDGAQLRGIEPHTVLVCFSSRGLADASPTLEVVDSRGRLSFVDIFAGGAAQVR